MGNRYRPIIDRCSTKHWLIVDWCLPMYEQCNTHWPGIVGWLVKTVRCPAGSGATTVEKRSLWNHSPYMYARPLYDVCCYDSGLFGRWSPIQGHHYRSKTTVRDMWLRFKYICISSSEFDSKPKALKLNSSSHFDIKNYCCKIMNHWNK
jgi:hypothetical protein